MLKFFYRLKRRHGVVLFAVIAIMTLLIAAATTAYFTARASYQTVVSNYDFSQTYLSAISISDMLIEAVTQDTSHPGADNKFGELKDAVQKLRDNKTPNAADAVITGYSKHGTSKTAATASTILELAANEPVEAGIFDAAKVEIKYIKKEPVPGSASQSRHYFTFTTTVYYRDTTITVQDTIINTSGTKSVTDASPFSRFFTSTSQTAAGKETGTSRVVVIDCNEISDDSYFENDYTLIGFDEHAGNTIKGSITSSGSVYMYQMKTDMPNTVGNNRNDWFIGKDLVMTANSGQNIDLKGSNIYIGGDLILARSGINFTCANLYVKGKIYYLDGSSGSINANVYCGGISDIASDPQSRVSELNSILAPQGYSSGISYSNGNKSVLSINGDVGTWDDSTPITISTQKANGHKYEETLTTDITLGEAFKQKTTKYNYDVYTAKADTLKNDFDIDLGWVDNTSVSVPSDAILYDDLQSETYHGKYEMINQTTGSVNVGFSPWYIGNATYKVMQQCDDDGHVIYTRYLKDNDSGTVYLDETYVFDSEGYATMFSDADGHTVSKNSSGEIKYGSTDGSYATAHRSGNDVILDLPYVENGYLLGIRGAQPGKTSYNFETKQGKTMPVVLKANFNDGTSTIADDGTTDGSGNNAFSWSGEKNGSSASGYNNVVKLLKDGSDYGNVTFEIGNYAKTVDDKGTADTSDDEEVWKYVPATISGMKSGTITTPIYYEGENLRIGTEDQISFLPNDIANIKDGLNGMLDGSTSYPKSEYTNHVMLISNKNNGVAVDGSTKGHVLCGYLYAPNGIYNVKVGSQSSPVFGGMIISIYDCKESWFTYASPDPEIIKSLLECMSSEAFPGGDLPTAGIWSLQEGRNYIG